MYTNICVVSTVTYIFVFQSHTKRWSHKLLKKAQKLTEGNKEKIIWPLWKTKFASQWMGKYSKNTDSHQHENRNSVQVLYVVVLVSAMKACVTVEIQVHLFLTSALYGGEWLASCPGQFTPLGKDPPVHIQQGDWLGLRAGLAGCEERRLFCLWWESNHDPSVYVNNNNNIMYNFCSGHDVF